MRCVCPCLFAEDLAVTDLDEVQLGVYDAYRLVGRMPTIPSIAKLSLLLLTCRIAFAPIDAAVHLKVNVIVNVIWFCK